jgi:hypothetical protein
MLATALPLLAFFIFLLLTLVLRQRVIRGPWLFLLRSFFPNWRFYHRVGALPVLYVRFADQTQGWSAWYGSVPRAQRRAIHFVHNPNNNLALANQNLVEHLFADLQECHDAQALRQYVSYRLVTALAKDRALQAHAALGRVVGPALQFQFELRVIPPYGIASSDTTVLTSPVLPA